MRVMRARRSFRMVLHCKERYRFVPHAFKRAVIEIEVSHLDFGVLERIRVDREIVIVGSDLDLPGALLANWMIAAVMPEL